VQTFLPLPSFSASAESLDLQRLGKQIIESRQIGRALTDPDYGWQRHPAVQAWRGHLGALLAYSAAMNDEWVRRRGKAHGAYLNMEMDHLFASPDDRLPGWLGWEAFHLSHRSNLIRKNPAHYGALWPGTPPDLPYIWPKP